MKTKEVAAFCRQIAYLLGAGIPPDGAMIILAEDAESPAEQEKLGRMAEKASAGQPLHRTMEEEGDFPVYVVKMARVAQETGTLESVMNSLADYYERENSLAKTIRNAVTYPLVMVFMLLTVLFILLTRVMPIFEGVYQQLGTQLSPITKTAVQLGTVVTGFLMGLILLLAIAVGVFYWISGRKDSAGFAERILSFLKEKNRISSLLAKRRFSSILANVLSAGLDPEKAVELSLEVIHHRRTREKLLRLQRNLAEGLSFYESLRQADLLSSLDLQMVKVGSHSGKTDQVFRELAAGYETEADEVLEGIIARFEPTMVVVLALVVGLILLAVMMPLVGIMAAIG